jgi:Golgi phosphoprotein 3 (GPP34)
MTATVTGRPWTTAVRTYPAPLPPAGPGRPEQPVAAEPAWRRYERLSVTECVYLLAHDEDHPRFRCRLHPAILDVAVAAATVIEMLLDGLITLGPGIGGTAQLEISLAPDSYQPTPQLTLPVAYARYRLAREWRRDLRSVLVLLAPGGSQIMLGCLARTGVLTVTRTSVRRRVQVRPVDPYVLGVVRGRPRTVLIEGIPDLLGDVLCGLIQVLGLHEALYLDTRADLDADLLAARDRLARSLAPGGAVAAVITTLEAAAADHVVAVYR